MMKSLYSIAFCSLLMVSGNVAHAGKVKKAFEALSVYNYFKAKVIFEKKWDKNKAAASYGLSVIYGRNDNPFYSLDSAHLYISLSVFHYKLLDRKDKTKLEEFGVDSIAIENWKDTIDCKAFYAAVQKNSLSEFERYMLAYFDSDFNEAIERKRDSLQYLTVEAKNSSSAYQAFILSYPGSHLSGQAKSALDERLYLELMAKDDLLSYQNFVKKYPLHPKKAKVEDSVYFKSVVNRSIADYEKFIAENPNNRNISSAWRNIYKLFTADYSPKVIQQFKDKYTNYPFKQELQDDFDLANERFLPFQLEGMWGFMTRSGNVKVAAKYTFVEEYSEGLALVVLKGKIGFIDKLGEVVIPLEYDEGFSFKKGLAIVGKGDFFGIVNRVNKAIALFKYDFIEPCYSGIFLAALGSGYGYLNSQGVELTAMNYNYASDFSDDFAIIDSSGKKALIDTNLQIIIAFNFSKLSVPVDSAIVAKNDSLYGLISIKGDTILPFKYNKIEDFAGGLALIQEDNKYGYINTKGRIVIPIIYTYNNPASIWGKFERGYAKFQRKSKFGVLDSAGEEVSPAIFENLNYYSAKQLFPVKKKGSWGYANSELQLKVKYQFIVAEEFRFGYAIVKTDSSFGLINQLGEWILQPKYGFLKYVNDSVYIAKQVKVGLLNILDQPILPFIYDKIKIYGQGLLKIEEGENTFYFDTKQRRFIIPSHEL